MAWELAATGDIKKFEEPHSADKEFIDFVALEADRRQVIDLARLRDLQRQGRRLDRTIVVLHPHREQDCTLLRVLAANDLVARIFVIIWSGEDMVRLWLDGQDATNLHTGAAHQAPDPVQLEAARCMVSEQYNGLSTGRGKASVVQLLRVFTAAGYPLERETWLTAFFAAGGEFGHAEAVARLITEMQKGVKHRVPERYRPGILEILRQRTREQQ